MIGLSELHNVQNKKLWQRKYWITSEDAKIDKEGKYTDSAAGRNDTETGTNTKLSFAPARKAPASAGAESNSPNRNVMY